MIIYRIQNKEGRGPYRNGFLVEDEWIDDEKPNFSRHPLPLDDGLDKKDFYSCIYHNNHVLFGFNTLDQLKIWFNNNEIKKLATYGFFIYQIELSDETLFDLNSQCIFLKDDIIKETRI